MKRILMKIATAFIITGTLATTAVYADIAYNDAAISNKLVQMFKSDDKADDQKNVPQKTIKPTPQELLNQNTKKQTDPTPTPTEGGGGEPDDDVDPANGGLGGNTPETPDSVENTNRKKAVAKAETNGGQQNGVKQKEEIDWSQFEDVEGEDDTAEEEARLAELQKGVEQKKKTIVTKKTNLAETQGRVESKKNESAKLDKSTAETQNRVKNKKQDLSETKEHVAEQEQIIAELKGKKGDKPSPK